MASPPDKPNRGGARPGAGRKALPIKHKPVSVSGRILPAQLKKLDALAKRERVSRSELVARAILDLLRRGG